MATVGDVVEQGEQVTLHVSGECMNPLLNHKDKVEIKNMGGYLPGDVVAFYSPFLGVVLIHRLLGSVRIRGKPKILSMADNAARPDAMVEKTYLMGKVVTKNGCEFPVDLMLRVKTALRLGYWLFRLALEKQFLEKPSHSIPL